MRTRNNFGGFLAFSLWVVMAMPGVIGAQQVAEPKGDPPRAGINGITSPICVYCPLPVSQKSHKAKISGVVLLDVIVTSDGRVTKPIVLKGLDSALDESALEAVRDWKMKPALGPDGKPVNCRVQVEVTFHLHSNVATGNTFIK
jgi:TonB family protein